MQFNHFFLFGPSSNSFNPFDFKNKIYCRVIISLYATVVKSTIFIILWSLCSVKLSYHNHKLKAIQIFNIYWSRMCNGLEVDNLLFSEAFHSVSETHFQRNKLYSQALCLFFGNLVCWHIRLIHLTPDITMFEIFIMIIEIMNKFCIMIAFHFLNII